MGVAISGGGGGVGGGGGGDGSTLAVFERVMVEVN